MKKFLVKNKYNLVRAALLIPIILVSIISISHVTQWYDIANPAVWALYLSISVEIAAMVSILGFSLRMKGGAWAIFLIVTLIQMIGNIFFSYSEISESSKLFKSWVELTGPIWDLIGSDSTDVISMKRWLSFLEGGLLPIISLTSLHFFVKFNDNIPKDDLVIEKPVVEVKDDEVEEMIHPEVITNSTFETSKIVHDYKENLDEVEEMIHPEVITNSTFETSKIVHDYKENLDEVEESTGVTEDDGVSNYLDLQIDTKIVSDDKKKIEDIGLIWDNVKRLRDDGKLTIPTQEDIENEPTALAFTPYEVEEETVNEGISEGVNEGVNEGVENIKRIVYTNNK